MKITILFIALVTALNISAQTHETAKAPDIPTTVKAAFEKEFPGKKASWIIEDKGFEAEFKLKGIEASANYDKNGHRKEFEIEIKKSELPLIVMDYIKKNYGSQKITEIAKITNDKNRITYEVEINKKDLHFDENGRFINN